MFFETRTGNGKWLLDVVKVVLNAIGEDRLWLQFCLHFMRFLDVIQQVHLCGRVKRLRWHCSWRTDSTCKFSIRREIYLILFQRKSVTGWSVLCAWCTVKLQATVRIKFEATYSSRYSVPINSTVHCHYNLEWITVCCRLAERRCVYMFCERIIRLICVEKFSHPISETTVSRYNGRNDWTGNYSKNFNVHWTNWWRYTSHRCRRLNGWRRGYKIVRTLRSERRSWGRGWPSGKHNWYTP